MQLYFESQMLGEVTDPSGEGFWMGATVHLSEAGHRLRYFFDWMVDEGQAGKDPHFSPGLLDPANWYLIDGEGAKRGIDVPAIHVERNEIAWRWRSLVPSKRTGQRKPRGPRRQ